MREKLKDLVAEERTNKQRLGLVLTAAGFAAFTLLIFAPFELYMSNAGELWFPFSKIIGGFLILFLAAFILMTAVGMLLKGKLLNLYVTLLFAVTVMLYLQGNFLNIDYGALDGRDILWEKYGAYSLINTAITTGILLIPFIVLYFSKDLWKNMVRLISLGLVAVQLITLVSFYFMAKPKPVAGDYGMGWEGALELSADENIVVILLDTFDNKLVDPLLEDDPECLDFLEGFTYYENTLGTYKFTYPSMTAHLTGELWYCDGTYADRTAYLNKAWESDELFTELHDLGYDNRVLGAWQYLGEARPDLIDNYQVDPKIVTSYPGLIGKMLQFVGFKYLPHVLKPGFWLYTGEFNHYKELSLYHMIDPLSYVRIQEEEISSDFAKKAFRMYHFAGMHLPYTLSENVTQIPESQGSMLTQAKGSLQIAREIMEQMKAEGVYDNSTVIIMADHGTVHDDIPDDAYNPVFLLKPKGERGALRTSQAPVWLMDLKATILHAAGVENYGDYGTSVFDLTEDTERERYFYCTHQPDAAGAGLTEFLVTGDANDYSNWVKTGRTWNSNGIEIDEE
ncbi:MAG: sulfatase-like hydrolase/transferase [Clostridia bacterium]|nr:sulfatase-like hydrolase/transferase [Clostridia bacterium]